MLNLTKRIFIVFTGVMLVLAPAAQASAVLAPSCAPMMKMPMPMDCCKTTCDCKVKPQSAELSVDVPVSAPRFELSQGLNHTDFLTVGAVSTETDVRDAEESPPSKDPLYQTYSDYRL